MISPHTVCRRDPNNMHRLACQHPTFLVPDASSRRLVRSRSSDELSSLSISIFTCTLTDLDLMCCDIRRHTTPWIATRQLSGVYIFFLAHPSGGRSHDPLVPLKVCQRTRQLRPTHSARARRVGPCARHWRTWSGRNTQHNRRFVSGKVLTHPQTCKTYAYTCPAVDTHACTQMHAHCITRSSIQRPCRCLRRHLRIPTPSWGLVNSQ